jgi:hypothetical protein
MTSKYLMQSFPRERTEEHKAIDLLRQSVNMAKTAACLIDDSTEYRDDDSAHSDYLMTVAKESAELALSVLEDALKLINQEIAK